MSVLAFAFLSPEQALKPRHPVRKKPHAGSPKATATTASFAPINTAAVFQVHRDVLDFWDVKSQLAFEQ